MATKIDTTEERCPKCNCDSSYGETQSDGNYLCNECGWNSGRGVDYPDPIEALFDLQTVFVRLGVIAAHVRDLVQASNPESFRTIALLTELDLLTKDGMTRLEQAGIEL